MSQHKHTKHDRKPYDKPYSELQRPKSNSRTFIIAILITTVLFMLLLIPTCTQASQIITTKVGVNHG